MALAATSARAASFIDTTVAGKCGSWEGFGLGAANTATYGQTFTVGDDALLNSFSLFLEGPTISAPLQFKAYIFNVDGQSPALCLWTLRQSGYQGVDGQGVVTSTSSAPTEELCPSPLIA